MRVLWRAYRADGSLIYAEIVEARIEPDGGLTLTAPDSFFIPNGGWFDTIFLDADGPDSYTVQVGPIDL